LYGTGITVGKLQPSVAKEVSYVFEIPKDATGLKFIVRDKTEVAKSVDLKK
jgi:aromatic ring hydroxylase